jgi:cell wall-associated NlpC family hydrolase
MDETVGLDFNVGGNYAASLNQMIAQSEQYARGADTMVGAVAKLNVGVTALIGRTTALTQANKVATAEAAAYQQRLEKIEASTKVTGTSFEKLRKTTLELGRSLGDVGKAVRYVESLQKSGVTAERTIGMLAKQFKDLDAANGLEGLGTAQLALNRTFGNSETSVGKYGDTLTTLSAKYGAAADGTLAFAKALAPVASSVGMSETAVMGLGAAAARLGEDGYASANAFNRVLLDMSRSIRNGTPEIKEYATLLNVSSTALSQMFRDDPTEVLVRFTEAIRRGGPEAQRSLEALGLDTVRTTRAITALSGQGNLRDIMDEASKAYGNNSSARAAEVVLGGVNTEMARLGETMSQTVASAGRPFLGFLEQVLSAGNAVSGKISEIADSKPVETLGQVGAVGSMAGSLLWQGGSVLATVALARRGFDFTRRNVATARAAADLERTGNGAAMVGINDPAARAGAAYGRLTPNAMPGSMQGGLRSTVTGAWRLGGNTAAGLLNMQANDWASSDWYSRGLTASAGRNVSPEYRTFMRAARSAATYSDDALAAMGTTRGEMAAWTASYGRDQGLLAPDAGRSAAGRAGRAGWQGARYAGRELRRGVTSGPGMAMLGVTAGVMGADWLMGKKAEQDELSAISSSGTQDAFAQFNDFAAAAGIAGRGLVSFTATVSESTRSIAAGNRSLEEAFSVNSREASNAASAGYQRAFSYTEGSTSTQIAEQIRLVLGANASNQAIGRALMDVSNQSGSAEFANIVGVQAKPLNERKDVYGAGVRAIASGQTIAGVNTEASREAAQNLGGEITRNATDVGQSYGASAQEAASFVEARKAYEALKNEDLGEQARRTAGEQIVKALGLDPDNSDRIGQEATNGASFDEFVAGVMDSRDPSVGRRVSDFLSSRSPVTSTGSLGRYLELKGQGFNFDDPQYSGLAQAPEVLQRAWTSSNTMQDAQSGKNVLVPLLFSAQEAAKSLDKTVSTLDESDIAKLPEATQKMIRLMNEPTTANRGAAARQMAEAASRTYSNPLLAQLGLATASSSFGAEDPMRQAAQLALQQMSRDNAVTGAGMMTSGRWARDIQAGNEAEQLGFQEDPQAEAARNQQLDARAAAQQGELGFMKQFNLAKFNLDVQLRRQEEDAQRARARSNEDFYIQMGQAEEDFGIARSRAYRDFNISMKRADEDYNISRLRAQRDFGKSLKRAVEDQAQSAVDPYKRLQAQQVWDARSLLVNLNEQNASIGKQASNLAQLRQMKVSQQVIDTLRLGDPGNAQQTQRMVEDLMSNPALVRALNASVGGRLRATQRLTGDPANNRDLRRQVEDFRVSMNDASIDFRKQRNRASADFKKNMSDNAADFDRQMSRAAAAHGRALTRMDQDLERSTDRAQEDLANMGKEVGKGLTDTTETFLKNVADMPKQLQPKLSENIKYLAQTASADLAQFLKDIGTAMGDVPWPTADPRTSPGRTGTDFTEGGAPVGDGPPDSGATGPAAAAIAYAKRQLGKPYVGDPPGAEPPESWDCSKLTTWAYKQSGVELTPYSYSQAEETNRVPDSQRRPGDLLFFFRGAHHVALYAGDGKYIEAGSPSTGVHWSSIGNDWYDQHYSFTGRPKGLWGGGIVRKNGTYELADGGSAEAVVPLDHRGASAMADAMVRYADSAKIRTALVAPYGTPTSVTYHYDSRTQITGPVTVQSQDPEDMGRRLAAKQRRDRLVQPAGR